MRDFKGMKRQRGRNRGGNAGQGGGGKPQQHNANRSFESNGPDNVKIRGNAQHVFEKYQQLARDASTSGDRVLAENYLQHAEHYFRVVRAVQPTRPVADIIGRDTFTSGYDIDFEDESGAQADPGEAPSAEGDAPVTGHSDGEGGEQRQDRNEWQTRDRQRDDRQRDDRDRNYNRDDRPRDDRPRDDRQQQDRYRDDRPRDDRPRDDRPRDGQRDDRPRDDRPRDDRPRDNNQQPRDGQRDDRPRRDRYGRDRFDRNDRPRDPATADEPVSNPVSSAPAEGERQLRSQDGSLSPAPAFLQARSDAPPRAVETEDGEAKKPRRRRAPRSFEGGEGEGSAAPETEEV